MNADLCVLGVGLAHSGQCRIDQDATTVLTDYDFLVHFYLHLSLGRDAVEATAAGVALHIHHAQTVAGVLADALEGCQQAGVEIGRAHV